MNVKLPIIFALLMQSLSLQSYVFAGEVNTEPRIGIQLWSVKDYIKKDIRGTLSELRAMGFEGVEWAGEFGEFKGKPEALKGYMDSIGLVSSAAHVSFDALSDENIDQTIALYKTLGAQVFIIPWDERAIQLDTVQQTIDDLNRLAPVLAERGMSLGYHNHKQEFETQDGTTTWDRIAQSTPATTILQLDVSWATIAGKNAADYARKYGSRTATTHFKAAVIDESDSQLIPIIGADSIDWPDLIKAIYTETKARWIILEQEDYPGQLTPMQSVRLSKLALDGLLLEHGTRPKKANSH